jgi:hypothetical protein
MNNNHLGNYKLEEFILNCLQYYIKHTQELDFELYSQARFLNNIFKITKEIGYLEGINKINNTLRTRVKGDYKLLFKNTTLLQLKELKELKDQERQLLFDQHFSRKPTAYHVNYRCSGSGPTGKNSQY